jgi:hypothetical protein
MRLTLIKLTSPVCDCKNLSQYNGGAFGGNAPADRRSGLAVFAGARP